MRRSEFQGSFNVDVFTVALSTNILVSLQSKQRRPLVYWIDQTPYGPTIPIYDEAIPVYSIVDVPLHVEGRIWLPTKCRPSCGHRSPAIEHVCLRLSRQPCCCVAMLWTDPANPAALLHREAVPEIGIVDIALHVKEEISLPKCFEDHTPTVTPRNSMTVLSPSDKRRWRFRNGSIRTPRTGNAPFNVVLYGLLV